MMRLTAAALTRPEKRLRKPSELPDPDLHLPERSGSFPPNSIRRASCSQRFGDMLADADASGEADHLDSFVLHQSFGNFLSRAQ